MIKKWIISLVISCAMLVPANPVSEFQLAGISEVQWIDSLNWAFELRSSLLLWGLNLSLPCTTEAVKLYLPRTKSIYSTRLYFNPCSEYEGLAVLTPSSIIGIPPAEKVMIRGNETVFIPNPQNDTLSYPLEGWICRLSGPIQNGCTMIGIGQGEFVESSRPSIGTLGNYQTLNHLVIMDRDKNLLSGVNSYIRIWLNLKIDSYLYGSSIVKNISGTDGQIMRTAWIGEAGIAHLCFQSGLHLDLWDSIFPTWRFFYQDRFPDYYDTIILAPNFHKITVLDSRGNLYDSLMPKTYDITAGENIGQGEYLIRLFKEFIYPINFYLTDDSVIVASCTLTYTDTRDTLSRTITALTTPVIRPPQSRAPAADAGNAFSALGNLSDGVRFVFSIRYPAGRASIDVYSLNGKKAATIPVSSGAEGTHSVYWNPVDASGRKLSSGNYLCNFQIDHKTVASQRVSLF